MKRKQRTRFGIAGAILLTTALAACAPGADGPAGMPVSADMGEAAESTAIQVVTLERQTFRSYLELTGTLEARNQIQVTVEEGGILREVLVKKGEAAEEGDTLARLENRIVEAGYKQAQAALRQAELDFNSKKVLFERKAISENEFLQARYSYEAALASYELAEARRDKLSVEAPIPGVVNDRYYDLGAYATPLTPIFEMIDAGVMRVNAGVAERFRGDIEEGTTAEITFDAFPEWGPIDATVDFVSRAVDPRSRTFEIEMEIPNVGGRLAPNMVANVRILRRTYNNAIVIPIDALVETEDGWYVFVEQNGRAKRVPIEQLAVHEDSVVVEGLLPEQRLIVAGHQELADGDPVSVAST